MTHFTDTWTHFQYFFSGDFINRYYFPVFIPIGIVGNILSFLVSTTIQCSNAPWLLDSVEIYCGLVLVKYLDFDSSNP